MVGVLRLLRWPMAALAVVVGSAVGGAKGGGMLGPTSPAATTCGTWPQVGNDVSNTRSSEGGPSASQVPTLQVKWRFQATDGDFTGTPVLADCTVFVGSNGGTVRALDEQTGAVEWAENLG